MSPHLYARVGVVMHMYLAVHVTFLHFLPKAAHPPPLPTRLQPEWSRQRLPPLLQYVSLALNPRIFQLDSRLTREKQIRGIIHTQSGFPSTSSLSSLLYPYLSRSHHPLPSFLPAEPSLPLPPPPPPGRFLLPSPRSPSACGRPMVTELPPARSPWEREGSGCRSRPPAFASPCPRNFSLSSRVGCIASAVT